MTRRSEEEIDWGSEEVVNAWETLKRQRYEFHVPKLIAYISKDPLLSSRLSKTARKDVMKRSCSIVDDYKGLVVASVTSPLYDYLYDALLTNFNVEIVAWNGELEGVGDLWLDFDGVNITFVEGMIVVSGDEIQNLNFIREDCEWADVSKALKDARNKMFKQMIAYGKIAKKLTDLLQNYMIHYNHADLQTEMEAIDIVIDHARQWAIKICKHSRIVHHKLLLCVTKKLLQAQLSSTAKKEKNRAKGARIIANKNPRREEEEKAEKEKREKAIKQQEEKAEAAQREEAKKEADRAKKEAEAKLAQEVKAKNDKERSEKQAKKKEERKKIREDNRHIIDVWKDNVEQEMSYIKDILVEYPVIGMDTEYPGTILLALDSKGWVDEETYFLNYDTVKGNTDILNLIQLGLSFSNDEGTLASSTKKASVWQFNFWFNKDICKYDSKSMQLLEEDSGFDFTNHKNNGIAPAEFKKLFMSSGILCNPKVKWVCYSGAYDFGYLLKLATGENLPEELKMYEDLVKEYFPVIYDVTTLLKRGAVFHEGIQVRRGGLKNIAGKFDVKRRYGTVHQAGSDSLLALDLFHRLKMESMGEFEGIKSLYKDSKCV